MENNKKILVPTIIAVVTLVLLVFGATYAYFTVGSTNNFGTKELNATVEDMAGSVVLEQVNNTLSLNVTRAMMSEDNAGTYYYASGSSTPANIAKISTSGEGTFTCTYKLSVTKSASSEENDLYNASVHHEDVSLYLNNQIYNFANLHNSENSFPIIYNGTISGVSKDNPQYITSNLEIANAYHDQSYLKGKDMTLTYSISDFNCELEKPAPIYAIYGEDETGEPSLYFYQNHDEVNIGDTYDGYTVVNIYKNLNNTNYTSRDEVPWISYYFYQASIEDRISPTNTAYWFAGLDAQVYNLDNLDTSKVTDMSYMFATGNVNIDLSNWDTSNVTNMSGVFSSVYLGDTVDLSNWDISKVTNMTSMFQDSYISGNTIGLESWDTSNVTNMTSMFKDAVIYDGTIDLSEWSVPLVTQHNNFYTIQEGMEEEYTIIEPIWVN